MLQPFIDKLHLITVKCSRILRSIWALSPICGDRAQTVRTLNNGKFKIIINIVIYEFVFSKDNIIITHKKGTEEYE